MPDEILPDDPTPIDSRYVEAQPTSTPLRKQASRVSIVEMIYYLGESPLAIDTRYNYSLKSDEQPYGPRYMTVGEKWVKLDAGWLEEQGASMLILKNEPIKEWGNPTKEQKTAQEAAVVELVVGNPKIESTTLVSTCSPHRSIHIEPPELDRLWLKCRKGSTRVTIYLFPL